MKDKYDLYMEEALQPTMEPDSALNERIIAESKKSKRKFNRKVVFYFAKAAVAAVILVIFAPKAVNAAEFFKEKYFVTKHSISTGDPEYVNDDWLMEKGEELSVEDVQHEDGDSSVNWLSKKVERFSGNATLTSFYYDDYSKALADSGHDNLFDTKYETQNATYSFLETSSNDVKSLDADLVYFDKTFHVTQESFIGNVESNRAHSIVLQNTGNVRTYEAKSGEKFTLVDENRKDGDTEKIRTYTMIAYGKVVGYLSFEEFSEAEIQSVLNSIRFPQETMNTESNADVRHLFEDENGYYIAITKGELKQGKSVSMDVNVFSDECEKENVYKFKIEISKSLYIGAYDYQNEYFDLGFYTPNYIASIGDNEALDALIEICVVDINDDKKKEAIVSYGSPEGHMNSDVYELTSDKETGKISFQIIGRAHGEGSVSKADIKLN